MKYEDARSGVRLHWLVCDNCGYFTEQYEDEGELCTAAKKEGWRLNCVEGHYFCSRACMLEYIRKFITPGTELDKRHVWFPARGRRGEMMEFNDSVTTFVDYPGELERRELEVLLRLEGFVAMDVQRRRKELRIEEMEKLKELDDVVDRFSDRWLEIKHEIEERYEKAIKEEYEREERLRRAILGRAERAFPELRVTNYELRVENSAASPRGDFRPVSGDDAGDGSLTSRGGESATGFMTSQGGSCNRTEVP